MLDAACLVPRCLVCFWLLVSTYRIWHAIYQDIVHSHRMHLGICHTLARRAGALIFGSSFGCWVGLRYCYMMTTTFGNKKKSIFSFIIYFYKLTGPLDWRMAHGHLRTLKRTSQQRWHHFRGAGFLRCLYCYLTS
ncbi:hypothetical protein V8C34DRAFT_97327 [Trichoderma compactum]